MSETRSWFGVIFDLFVPGLLRDTAAGWQHPSSERVLVTQLVLAPILVHRQLPIK